MPEFVRQLQTTLASFRRPMTTEESKSLAERISYHVKKIEAARLEIDDLISNHLDGMSHHKCVASQSLLRDSDGKYIVLVIPEDPGCEKYYRAATLEERQEPLFPSEENSK